MLKAQLISTRKFFQTRQLHRREAVVCTPCLLKGCVYFGRNVQAFHVETFMQLKWKFWFSLEPFNVVGGTFRLNSDILIKAELKR